MKLRINLMETRSAVTRGLWHGLWCGLWMIVVTLSSVGYAEEFVDADVDTLAPIEIPGTVVAPEPRRFPRLTLEVASLQPLPKTQVVVVSDRAPSPTIEPQKRSTFRDVIALSAGGRTRVVPIRAERPPYPRVARERGWEGTVTLRLAIHADGSVGNVVLKRTSGHTLLDDAARRAVQHWRFTPAKDGEFSVPSIIDLPMKFDLHQ